MLRDFVGKIEDLLGRKEVARLKYYPGHRVHHRSSIGGRGGTGHARKVRLAHCVRVAYLSYTIAGLLHLDRRVLARAGLLHDCGFDPRSDESRIVQILKHPLRGALISHRLGEAYEVSSAIHSHMFPLNYRFPPSTGASLVLWFADKMDAVFEIISLSTVLDKELNQYIITRKSTEHRGAQEKRIRV